MYLYPFSNRSSLTASSIREFPAPAFDPCMRSSCFDSIFSLMYWYYAFSALKLPFPQVLKKSLTKLQITQFLIGGSLATSYLFIQLPMLSEQKSAVLDKLSFGQLSLDSLARMGTQCVVDQGQRAAVWLSESPHPA